MVLYHVLIFYSIANKYKHSIDANVLCSTVMYQWCICSLCIYMVWRLRELHFELKLIWEVGSVSASHWTHSNSSGVTGDQAQLWILRLLLSSNGYTQSFTTFPCSKQAVKGINKHDRIISDIISICIVLPSLYQGNLNHSIMLTPDARIETTKYYRQGGQTSNVDDSSRTRFAKKKSYKSNKNKSTKTGHFAKKKPCPDCFTSRNFPTASNNRSTPQNVLIIRALSKDHPNTTFL